jgi:hypothetical protein
MMKPSKKVFMIGLGALAGILLLYGGLRWKFGAFLPAAVDKNLPDFVMFAAVGVMLWNRKIRKDEDKAEAERKRLEAEAAAPADEDPEESAEEGSGESAEDGSGESGGDARG